MVMFLFVIAYVGYRFETPWAGGPSWQAVAAIGAAGALLTEIIVAIGLKAGGRLEHSEHVNRPFGTPGWIGRLFLTDHLLAFEITSIVLLVAAVGGVILGTHSRRAETGEPEPELTPLSSPPGEPRREDTVVA
jgi:NADH:ubiquinone oxidoreductase subunit 6 (subunit J)